MAAELTVGVVPGVGADKWVRVWRERMPDVLLTVVPVAEDGAPAALADGVDLVFARLPISAPEDEVHIIPLWEETPVVVAAKDSPIKVFDTVTEADLAGEEVQPGWDEATLDLVAAGHGIARMPQSVFRATGRRDLVSRPVSDATPTRVGLVWRKDAGGELIDEFIGVVRGRTAHSSRGVGTTAAAEPSPKRAGRPAPSPRPRSGGRRGGGRAGRRR